ncbi:unnamed protein product [Effrenium voratum]|uniref:Uncharacterized protein n=1 Tax=Effrenium voratum TaxID=2562239 RepID=A0AA36HZ54_9DINO|nr:unnamed protein product [Effrenium voratum]
MGVHVETVVSDQEVFNDVKIWNNISGDLKKALYNCRALDGMTPFQEYCNALSMVVPGALCLYLCLWPSSGLWWTWRMSIIAAAVLLHLPFSMAFHLLLAQRKLQHSSNNTARRLDQTFIHVTCMASAAALSTSEVYCSLCILLNMYFISRLWAFRDAGVTERMANIGMAVLLYWVPPLLRGDFQNTACGVGYFVLGALCMHFRLGGWGHSLLHILSGGLCYHILAAGAF